MKLLFTLTEFTSNILATIGGGVGVGLVVWGDVI